MVSLLPRNVNKSLGLISYNPLSRNPNPEFLSALHLDEFLPAVNSWMIWGGVLLPTAMGIAVMVGAITPLPVTVKADGVVRPQGEIKVVQSSLDGIISMIAIGENQSIESGAIIATLDNASLKSKKQQSISNITQNKQQLLQVEAQVTYLDRQISAEEYRVRRTVTGQKAELELSQSVHREKQEIAQAQVEEAEANLQVSLAEKKKINIDLTAAKSSVNGSKIALKILQKRRERYKSVAESGALPKDGLEEIELIVNQSEQILQERLANVDAQEKALQRQEKIIAASRARLNQSLASLHPSNSVVKIAQEKIAQEQANGLTILARLEQEKKALFQRKIELMKQIEGENAELEQINIELGKTTINAPISGIILKSNLRNVSQSVRSGEEIAQIAPRNTNLVIKALVAAQDRGKIKVNQLAQMRVSAYPYPDYGILEGKVVSISPDIINSERSRINTEPPYYEVIIRPDRTYLKDNTNYGIQSGMDVSADIVVKQETVLQFIARKARLTTDF